MLVSDIEILLKKKKKRSVNMVVYNIKIFQGMNKALKYNFMLQHITLLLMSYKNLFVLILYYKSSFYLCLLLSLCSLGNYFKNVWKHDFFYFPAVFCAAQEKSKLRALFRSCVWFLWIFRQWCLKTKNLLKLL